MGIEVGPVYKFNDRGYVLYFTRDNYFINPLNETSITPIAGNFEGWRNICLFDMSDSRYCTKVGKVPETVRILYGKV